MPARIAVIGGYAQLGVPAGFGSSTVVPAGGYAADRHHGGIPARRNDGAGTETGRHQI
ncbi:hypothetical protein MAHJHV50_49560 [Mycobacterium avium subsp. hominissuis]